MFDPATLAHSIVIGNRIITIKKDSYFCLEELSFLNNVFQSLAILQMIMIRMDATIDHTMDITSRAMSGKNVRIAIAL